MSVAVLLGLFAITLGWAVPSLLVGARWTRRAPRLAVATWQGLSVSMVLALLVAPVALVVAFTPVTRSVAAWLSACRMLLQAGLGGSGSIVAATAGLALEECCSCVLRPPSVEGSARPRAPGVAIVKPYTSWVSAVPSPAPS